MNNNVMLDLETWGTRPGCAIRSIGAVLFDPHSGQMGQEFYCNVSTQSCRDMGLKIEPDTVKWWNLPKNAKASLTLDTDPLHLREAISDFCKWFTRERGVFVWSQGANFDEPIIGAAMDICRQRTPWKFKDVRDTRTAYDIASFNSYQVTRDGTHHNALDDAKHQARCVHMAYAKLKGGML